MKTKFKEKILVGRLKLKDKEAFSQLYDIYIDKLYRFIYFKVSNIQEAEDLTSQTFLKIWQCALEGKIKIGGSFQAFLYKTSRNLIIDYYRRNLGKESYSIEEGRERGLDIVDKSKQIEKEIENKLETEKIEQKIKNLKSEYQEVIVLYYLNELSIPEIAEVLNKKSGAVRVLLHRAIKSLKEEI